MKNIEYPDKYQLLIDQETWAFIERTNAFYPLETADFPIEKQRQIYDTLCREFFAGYPDGVIAEDGVIKAAGHDVAFRLYTCEGAEPMACVLYCHGGGYVVGGLESHDDICAEICAHTGFLVLSIDYRLSPEHAHPAAYEDTLSGFEYMAAKNQLPIIMAGDSAGANLVAAVGHATRKHERKPAGQVLIYPALGGDMSKGSYVDHGEAPLLNFKDISFYNGIRGADEDCWRDPSYAPLADTDFAGLPPTLAVSAQCDPLSDDGRDYRDRIVASGGRAAWFNEPGLVHGYLRARHSVKRARHSFERIVDAISVLGKGDWVY